jgi:VWFA-related protein
MPWVRTLLFGAGLGILGVIAGPRPLAEGQQTAAAPPTFRVTSNLVFLDVMVLDKKGHPVVTGLTKDDFSITDDGKPQRIFSFDAPATGAKTVEDAPATVLVLDLLNTPSKDFAFARDSIRRYLALQPERLISPTELMVLNNTSLDMIHAYTRSRAELMYAVEHVPWAVPYKLGTMQFGSQDWLDERLSQSIEALQQIALQNKGLPRRKNILWIGNGGPSIPMNPADPRYEKSMRFYAHGTTNMLVDARMSLFLIDPKGVIGAQNPDYLRLGGHHLWDTTEEIAGDPFAGSINFGMLVHDTGGVFFHDRNDVDAEMHAAQELGSDYYTLTYQPPMGEADGKFRHIEVHLRDPNLHAMTKTGYYAPEPLTAADLVPERVNPMDEISEAAQSSVTFDSLGLSIVHVVRHPDHNTAELTVLLKSTHLRWQATDNGHSGANITVAAVSLSNRRDIVGSRLERLVVLSNSQDAARLAQSNTLVTVTVPTPHRTDRVRVVIRADDGGEIGTAELDHKALLTAPESPTPEPHLVPRPQPVVLTPQQ